MEKIKIGGNYYQMKHLEVMVQNYSPLLETLKEIVDQSNYEGFGEPSSRLTYVMTIATAAINNAKNIK